MTVPAWLNQAVFYQIFPDRFYQSGLPLGMSGFEPWGSPPTIHGFQGGNLTGIVEKLDYLTELGINALYLNPIFQSPSNHRYNITEYFAIDPKLGNLDDFRLLITRAHERGIKVVLDGVFNHCGRGFFAFDDLLENQQRSVYRDWFYVKQYPVDAYSPGEAKTYEAWWGFKSLPKFNVSNPGVRDYLFRAIRFWTEQGIDGWRLDVPNEIDDDAFWFEFRTLVKGINPDAYLVGEIWDINPRWVGDAHFDGLMNYPLRAAILDYVNAKIASQQFIEKVQEITRAYSEENLFSHLNLLGSHDTERILRMCQSDKQRLFMAFCLIFALPGIPCIYYGDEIGMDGGKDPDCRRAFLWAENTWDKDLREKIKRLINVRKTCSALQNGALEFIPSNPGLGIIKRSDGKSAVFVVVNPGSNKETFYLACLNIDRQLKEIISESVFSGDMTCEIPPKSVLFLTTG